MTKHEFIIEMTKNTGLLYKDAKDKVELVFSEVERQVKARREVRIDGVGHFAFKYREIREVQDNIAGIKRVVQPSVKLKFKAFPSMKKFLTESFQAERK